MSLFGGNGKSESSTEEEKDPDEVRDEIEEPPEPVTKTGEYTEHEARISFTDGNVKSVTFDAMKQKNGLVYFKNYTGYHVTESADLVGRERITYTEANFSSEVFLSVCVENVKYIETVERRQKEMTTEYVPQE